MSPGLRAWPSLCGAETEKALSPRDSRKASVPTTKITSSLSQEGLTGLLEMILRSKLIVGNSGNTTNSGRISMSELWTPGLEPLWTLAKGLTRYKRLKQFSLQ